MTGQVRETIGIYAGAMRGHKCWIIGSGPSTDDFDLTLLGDRYIIALNATIEAFIDHARFPHAWWFFTDLRAYHETWNRIKSEVKRIKMIVHKRAMEAARSIRCNARFLGYVQEGHFKHQRTCVETALLIADYLGFDEIYLAGIDFAIKKHQPYAKQFMWKHCYFFDKKDSRTESKSCNTMLRCVREMLPRVKRAKVFQTSPLFPDPELIPYVSFDEALGRTIPVEINGADRPSKRI